LTFEDSPSSYKMSRVTLTIIIIIIIIMIIIIIIKIIIYPMYFDIV